MIYHLTMQQLDLFCGLSVFFGWLAFLAIYGIGFRAGRIAERMKKP